MAKINKEILEETIRKAALINIPLRTSLKISTYSIVSSRVSDVQWSIYQKYGVWFERDEILNNSIDELAYEIEETLKEKGKTTFSSDKSTQKADARRRLNIVVVGRSGVGKSSFLNYAAGKQVFETGIGDPVTQSYFASVDVEKHEKKVVFSLFDTKGIEAGNTKEWSDAVFKEIDRRDESDNIYDWFHTILFCIDASSKRIQPFEIETIKKISEHGSVLVLLTKKDLVSTEILDGLRKQIASEIGDKVQVLSVCNVNTRTRKGESHASGLEDVLRVSFLGLWEKMANLLPQRIANNIATIHTQLEVDCDLSDLIAYMALGSRIELKDGTRLYPEASELDFPGKKTMKPVIGRLILLHSDGSKKRKKAFCP